MKKVIMGGVLGGLVFMIWQSISWMALPWHVPDNIPDDQPIIEMFKQRQMEHGVYVYPGFPDERSKNLNEEDKNRIWEEFQAKYSEGPRIAKMIYIPEGGSLVNPLQFVRGMIMNILMVFIAAWLLSAAAAKMRGFGDRFLFVFLIGVVASLAGPLTDWNWWNYPMGYIFAVTLDMLIGWFVVAVVVAVIMKKPIRVISLEELQRMADDQREQELRK